MFIAIEDADVAFPVRLRDRNQFVREVLCLDRSFCALLAFERKVVLCFARDSVLTGDVLGCLRHRIRSVLIC